MKKKYRFYPHFEEILEQEGVYLKVNKIRTIDEARSLIEKYEESMGCMLSVDKMKKLEEEIIEIHRIKKEESFVNKFSLQEQHERYIAGCTKDLPGSVNEEEGEKAEEKIDEAKDPDLGKPGKTKETHLKHPEDLSDADKMAVEQDDKEEKKEKKEKKSCEDTEEVTEEDSLTPKIGMPVMYEGKEAVIINIVDDKASKVKIAFKDGGEKDNVDVSKLHKRNEETKAAAKDDNEEKKGTNKDDNEEKKGTNEALKDGTAPDGTGPHGRGMGPGKGKADGSGLKKDKKEEEKADESEEETSDIPTFEDIISEVLDNVALTKAQRNSIVSELTAAQEKLPEALKKAIEKKEKKSDDKEDDKEEEKKKEESTEEVKEDETSDTKEKVDEQGIEKQGTDTTPKMDAENEKKEKVSMQNKDEDPPADTGDKATKQKPEEDKGEEKVKVKDVDKKDKPMKESEVICKTVFSIYEFVLEEDLKDYLKDIIGEEKVDDFISEAIEGKLIVKSEDDVFTKGTNA